MNPETVFCRMNNMYSLHNTAPREILPEPTLRRLPWYLAYVSLLRSHHVEYVSSTAISRELNVDASQIAKDLSYLAIKGKTRIGYEVPVLEKELRELLGFTTVHNAFMIGTGSLGGALMADSGLSHYGLNIVAGFDVNPHLVGTSIRDIPIFHISSLEEKRLEFDAEIAVIAVPVEVAQESADTCVAAGIKALWNFTPSRIKTAGDIVIQNTSIYSHLAVMYNRLDTRNQGSL